MFDDLFADTVTLTIVIIALSFVCVIGTIIFSFLVYYLFARRGRKRAEALMKTGVQGQATVLSLEDTGMRINDNPRVRVGLEVRLEGYSPYKVQKTMTIPLIKLSQVQPGAEVAVMADPNSPGDPDKVGLLLR